MQEYFIPIMIRYIHSIVFRFDLFIMLLHFHNIVRSLVHVVWTWVYETCCGQLWVWHMFYGVGLLWVVPTNKIHRVALKHHLGFTVKLWGVHYTSRPKGVVHGLMYHTCEPIRMQGFEATSTKGNKACLPMGDCHKTCIYRAALYKLWFNVSLPDQLIDLSLNQKNDSFPIKYCRMQRGEYHILPKSLT